MYLVHSMRSFNVPLVESSFAQMTEVLSSAFDDAPPLAVRRETMVAAAISFDTWKAPANPGLSAEDAAGLMADVVAGCIG
jgi:hypothetical protein